MKIYTSTVAAAASAIAFSSRATADTIVSPPFKLAVVSNNEYNGSYFQSCHEGAATESLCVLSSNATDFGVFNFNTSSYDDSNTEYGTSGVLTFNLPVGTWNVSEPMNLVYDPISNVAVPMFSPNYDTTEVAFDRENKMNIQSSRDDKVSPPTYNGTDAYYRWYICLTDEGDQEETLSWVVGPGEPENPSCEKIDVIREFL